MTIAKQVDVRSNIKKIFDMAFDGEAIMIPFEENRNVVVISEEDYKEMEKARRNIKYLEKLDKSDQQLREGKIIVKTMEELEAMANE